MFQHSNRVQHRYADPVRSDQPVEIGDYLRILVQNWKYIVAGLLAGLVLALSISALITPKYESTTTLYVSVRATGPGDTGDLFQGASFAQAAVTSYIDVASTAIVLDRVADSLDIELEPGQLARSLEVSSPPESVLINITATHSDPQSAADIANATAEAFIAVVENEIEVTTEGQDSPVQVRAIDPGVVPDIPASPNTGLNGLLGLIIGTTVGIGVATLRGLLDSRIRSVQDIEQLTDSPVVGRIAQDDQITQRPLIVHHEPRSPRAEAFRSLRTNMQFLGSADGSKAFLVTSATPGEGKTHVVANLALVLAELGATVVLIDADLRKPRVAQVMGIEGAVGLSDVLIGRAELTDVVQPWGTGNLMVLPAGRIPPNPSELLGSAAMQEVLDTLAADADYVLVDAPPVLPVTDAAVLSGLTSGTLLVSASGKTKRHELEDAIESLESVEGNVQGIVLNKVPLRSSDVSGLLSYKSDETEATEHRRSTAR